MLRSVFSLFQMTSEEALCSGWCLGFPGNLIRSRSQSLAPRHPQSQGLGSGEDPSSRAGPRTRLLRVSESLVPEVEEAPLPPACPQDAHHSFHLCSAHLGAHARCIVCWALYQSTTDWVA